MHDLNKNLQKKQVNINTIKWNKDWLDLNIEYKILPVTKKDLIKAYLFK